MISYELSYELRRGEKSLERKTEERQLASQIQLDKRGKGRTSEEERGKDFGAVTETANPVSLTGI